MKSKLSFKTFITEDLSINSMDKALFIIAKYLKKKTGLTFFRMPGIEKFSGPNGKGFGIRFLSSKKNMSVRFNWTNGNPKVASLASLDIYLGNVDAKSIRLDFDTSVSLVKTLPIIVDIINNKAKPTGDIWTLPDGVPLNESDLNISSNFIIEARSSSADLTSVYGGVVTMLGTAGFSRLKVYNEFRSPGTKIFDALVQNYPDVIQVVGNKFSFVGSLDDLKRINADRDKVLQSIGASRARVSVTSGNEKFGPTGNIDEIENNRERLTYEKQLEDLENLIKLTVSGSANALFVAGRGGVGKTFTTEKILADFGLRDGSGYFKNTGSASAAGMYSLLFKYKNDVILFDDSDDALKDQESRNLLKAATDTKKIRKLVWNKMGKNVVDPEGDLTDEEILDNGQIPRYFEFTGKIIFISNLPMDKLDPDGALRTRAFIIDIDPTEEEIYDFMEKIVGDIKLEDGLSLDLKERKKVVDLLRKGKSKQSPNLRKLSRGLNMAAGALAAGVMVSDADLTRMIETYA